MNIPAIVYRCYNAAGELLYVGNTWKTIGERMGGHHYLHRTTGKNGWIVDVAHVEVDDYPTWQEASAAEKALIAALRPPNNKLHNPDWAHHRAHVEAFAARRNATRAVA